MGSEVEGAWRPVTMEMPPQDREPKGGPRLKAELRRGLGATAEAYGEILYEAVRAHWPEEDGYEALEGWLRESYELRDAFVAAAQDLLADGHLRQRLPL